jgi:hypothetical protein
MEHAILKLPEKLDLGHLLQCARQLDGMRGTKVITIEMGEGRYFPPFPMLFLAAKILEIRETHPDTQIEIRNHAEHSYAAHMGFFKTAGFDIGRELDDAKGNARYLPIRAFYKSELLRQPTDRFVELGDLIQRHADDIAAVVSQDERRASDFFNALSYSLRELIRNVFEHAETDRVLYCAQYWPAKQKVEVCILDRGIGIRQSLGTNPNFRFRTDKEALEMSLWPGVSGKTHLKSMSTNWANSGYGLYMTSRLSRHGGNFAIVSGDACIVLSKSMSKHNFNTRLTGTAIRMNLDTMEIGNVQMRLSQFRKEAQSIGEKYIGLKARNPSFMSMVLRRDFKMEGL